jgi:hypothetical protein
MSRFKTLPFMVVLLCVLAAIPLFGQEVLKRKEDLARAITSDSFLCMISRADPEDDFFCDSTKKVLDALKESGFVEEVTSGVLQLLPVESKEAAGELIGRMHEVLWAIEWPCISGYDHVFAERIRDGVVNFVFLIDGEEEFATKTFFEFRKLLAGLVLLSDELQLETERYLGADITALRLIESDVLDLSILRREGLLGVSFGSSRDNPREYMDQLDGLSGITGLVAEERYQKAFAGLPAGGAMRTYFDIERMFVSMKERFKRLLSSMPGDGEETTTLAFIFNVFHELDIFEYTTDVRSKRGDTLISNMALQLKPGMEEKKVYRSLFLHEPIPHFERYVPKDAVSFSVTSGIELLPLYELAIHLVEDNLPDAREVLAGWEKIQETYGINLKEDLLSWFEGGMITVDVPALKPGAMGNSVGITMFRLQPGERGEAETWLAGWLKKLKDGANRIGIKVTLKEVRAMGISGGFEIYQSMVPFFRPFVCVHDGYLVLSTAKGETLAYLDFLRKGGATILENETFLALAGTLPSRLSSIHYRNLENTVEDFKTALSVLSMMSMVIPKNSADTIVLKTILKTLPRLLPVIEAMDVYAAEVGYSVFDPEAERMVMKTVTKLKQP